MDKTQIFQSSFRVEPLKLYKSYPHFKNNEVNLLGSYGTASNDYYEVIFERPELYNEIILDSGAFTINNPNNKSGNNRLTIDGFKKYCKYTKNKFKFIINFDEEFMPGGFEKNHENLMELERSGISAVPVIHDYEAEKFDEIDFYLRHGYPLTSLKIYTKATTPC